MNLDSWPAAKVQLQAHERLSTSYYPDYLPLRNLESQIVAWSSNLVVFPISHGTARLFLTARINEPSFLFFPRHCRRGLVIPNCARPSSTVLCDTISIGPVCASGPVRFLSAIRHPRPSQSLEFRAMECPSPQSPGMSSPQFLEGRRTSQQWTR